jgi:choline dehydrogenase
MFALGQWHLIKGLIPFAQKFSDIRSCISDLTLSSSPPINKILKMKRQLSLPAFLSFLFLTTTALENTAKADTYDYIVVGSGPGGGTLAASLAKAGESVLLLEAGDDQGENLHEKVSGWASLAGNDPLMRWDFFVKYHSDPALQRQYNHLTWEVPGGGFYVGTTPPEGSKELGVYYPRSGTLGGCGTHNAQCAALPSDSDWNDIAKMTGDNSWR